MKFVFAVSSGAIIYVVETEPKYQECNTGNGKLECPCHNCYFSISKFVITRLDCGMASGSLGECDILFFLQQQQHFFLLLQVSHVKVGG